MMVFIAVYVLQVIWFDLGLNVWSLVVYGFVLLFSWFFAVLIVLYVSIRCIAFCLVAGLDVGLDLVLSVVLLVLDGLF